MDGNNHIDFNAPATLRKWPSIKNERARASDGPYLLLTALWMIASGSSWRSLQVSITCMKYILLHRAN
jgi:hypothetical protein